jgi:hypothetical protein
VGPEAVGEHEMVAVGELLHFVRIGIEPDGADCVLDRAIQPEPLLDGIGIDAEWPDRPVGPPGEVAVRHRVRHLSEVDQGSRRRGVGIPLTVQKSSGWSSGT